MLRWKAKSNTWGKTVKCMNILAGEKKSSNVLTRGGMLGGTWGRRPKRISQNPMSTFLVFVGDRLLSHNLIKFSAEGSYVRPIQISTVSQPILLSNMPPHVHSSSNETTGSHQWSKSRVMKTCFFGFSIPTARPTKRIFLRVPAPTISCICWWAHQRIPNFAHKKQIPGNGWWDCTQRNATAAGGPLYPANI
ncbi:hypothetical protein BGX38DRAFT_474354 [Terfezia claveryi]|nr:hypothetical protein BGX38DRAFT_474354 [Terfezia claveryi]